LKRYGIEKPNNFNIENVKGFKIGLICGETDLLTSSLDYNWLKDFLIKN
jgi:hypothetical protein